MTRWLAPGLVLVALLAGVAAAEMVSVGKAAPEIASGAWVNSEPLTMQKLRGRVVAVEFWTFG